LVKNPNHVKIADFGLAQMVDNANETVIETGGRMPLKWLAIECIEQGLYSHKSDVWSFGVTIWELLTYGKRPFPNVNVKDLLNLLKKGGRLDSLRIVQLNYIPLCLHVGFLILKLVQNLLK